MSDTCQFPLCKSHAVRDGYCVSHAVHFASKKTYSYPAPIAKQSEKRKVEQRVYVKIVKEKISKDDRCKIKSPVCTGKAQGMNHKQKRSPKNFLVEKNLDRCCNACNTYIEQHPKWAAANGFTVSKFKKDVA